MARKVILLVGAVAGSWKESATAGESTVQVCKLGTNSIRITNITLTSLTSTVDLKWYRGSVI